MNKKNTITLKTAKKWAKRWRTMESSYNKYHELNAFNIPKADLIEVLNEKGVASVRAYIGVEKFVDKDTGAKRYEEKLMVVGVDAKGKDMLSLDRSGEVLVAGSDGQIYDFTYPCPDACDPESPLMQ